VSLDKRLRWTANQTEEFSSISVDIKHHMYVDFTNSLMKALALKEIYGLFPA
jgi:hypothetical protein